MTIRLGKCWQGTSPFLIFQAETQLPSGERWRGFLNIDLRTRPAQISLQKHKPEDLLAAGAISNLIRKHAPGGRVAGLFEQINTGDKWLALHSGSFHYFLVTAHNPPEFRLISPTFDNNGKQEWTVMARLSSSGMFTKKHPFAESIPIIDLGEKQDSVLKAAQAGVKTLMPDLLASLQEPATSEPPGKAEDLGPSHLSLESAPIPLFQREARDQLARRLKTLRRSFQQATQKTPDESDAKKCEQMAHWIKTFSWLIKPGMLELKLDSAQTGLDAPTVIPLDPELTPGAQIDALFVAAKKKRKGLAMGRDRLKSIEAAMVQLEADLAKLRATPLGETEVLSILERNQLVSKSTVRTIRNSRSGSSQEKNKVKPKGMAQFRCFFSGGGIPLYVGRTAAENDELTKAARSNDWWIHAVGVHGSHVIVPAANAGSNLAERVMRDAGILALHFSKLKENRAGEVYVTRKQNLRKQKGMAPGLWTVLRSETAMIRYDQEELDLLFKGQENLADETKRNSQTR